MCGSSVRREEMGKEERGEWEGMGKKREVRMGKKREVSGRG